MNTVFVWTEGEYSDYCIIGVYSSRAAAEADGFKDGECRQLEEYQLDAYSNPRKLTRHTVTIVDGVTTVESEPNSFRDVMSDTRLRAVWQSTNDKSVNEYYWPPDKHGECVLIGCRVTCWADDEQHAAKIAGERWARFRADPAAIVKAEADQEAHWMRAR